MNRNNSIFVGVSKLYRPMLPVLLIAFFLLQNSAVALASPPVPDALAFAGNDQVIKQYFEIRRLRITFEILPLKSCVAMKNALKIKEMGEARRGSQQQLLALAQAHRYRNADAVPGLLYLKRYGVVITRKYGTRPVCATGGVWVIRIRRKLKNA